MPNVTRTALLPYSAADMYALILDVPAYPQFLPWCSHAVERSCSATEQVASLTVSKGPIKQSFTTRNVLVLNESVQMNLVEGPFRQLDGGWRLSPMGESKCRVSFALRFEFSSTVLSLTVGPVFDRIAASMVDAFVARAHQVYGGRASRG